MNKKRQQYLNMEMIIIPMVQDNVVRTSMTMTCEDPYESTGWEDSTMKAFSE